MTNPAPPTIAYLPSWKQTAVLCLVAVGCVSWWTYQLNRVEDRLDQRLVSTQNDIKEINTHLKDQAVILGRIDERTRSTNEAGTD